MSEIYFWALYAALLTADATGKKVMGTSHFTL